jgi:hypothetical protein
VVVNFVILITLSPELAETLDRKDILQLTGFQRRAVTKGLAVTSKG